VFFARDDRRTAQGATGRIGLVLIVAGTPLGNLGDASPRLREALSRADIIVAEDTRVAKSLIRALDITSHASFMSANEHSESAGVQDILTQAITREVLLVSDAGMPLISDPGYVLVSQARARNIPVSIIPGPSAGVSALAVSGLPTDRFVHEGFIPKKGREGYLRDLAREPRTMIFFESPHRLASTLADMADAFGSTREACVVRELTKMFEEVAWGTLEELASRFSGPTKGEIVVVVAGAPATTSTLDEALVLVQALMGEGVKRSEACARTAKDVGIAKGELYRASVAAGDNHQ
jgi:16S rRNA (cytidine1402-2'-O)-methyltransferase